MPIVVGVDGSDTALQALIWALEEARYRQTSVRAVHVWRLPAMELVAQLPPAQIQEAHEAEAHRLAQTVLEKAQAEAGHDVDATAEAVPGMPNSVLVGMSAGAQMLVVGTRGNGPFKRAVLGSVSSYCTHHAKCPVTVVPPREE